MYIYRTLRLGVLYLDLKGWKERVGATVWSL